MVSLALFLETSAYPLDWTYCPRFLPIPSFWILLRLPHCLAEVLARNSLLFYHACHWSVCHVRHWCLLCRSLMFVMPVLHVCQACRRWTKYLCCLVITTLCIATFASRFVRSTSLESNNRYSTETCLLMNSWKKNTLQFGIIHAYVACPVRFCFDWYNEQCWVRRREP